MKPVRIVVVDDDVKIPDEVGHRSARSGHMVVRRHPKSSLEDIRDGFDALADLYYAYWGDFFHLAIFDESDNPADVLAAYERTHERYFAAIGGPAATRVLELACGGGALSAWMADRTSGEVVGVDFSDRQLAHAAARAAERPRPNLRFVRYDIMQLAQLNIGQFDAAICLDAACYLPDRRAALGQVATRLRPGARLLLVDWCQSERATLLQRSLLLQPLCRHWAIAELGSAAAYLTAFQAAGFRILDLEDLSELVMPNWERGYRAALQALAEPMTLTRLTSLAAATLEHGARFVRAAEDQVQVALLAKAAAESGALRYISVLAERLVPTASSLRLSATTKPAPSGDVVAGRATGRSGRCGSGPGWSGRGAAARPARWPRPAAAAR